jgi:hypothetical protein
MKNILLAVMMILSTLIFSNCKKSETTTATQSGISYPASGLYGSNLLQMADSSVINPALTFSLAANLETDATLKIILTNLSSGGKAVWFYVPSSNKNWEISSFDAGSKQQSFTAKSGSSMDLNMSFADTLGKCKIDFYENNVPSPSKSKYLIWHQTKK